MENVPKAIKTLYTGQRFKIYLKSTLKTKYKYILKGHFKYDPQTKGNHA